MRRILHAGCGPSPLPAWLDGEEVRLDVDPATRPDIVASMVDLGGIGPFDAIYCSHALEHLTPEDGATALGEFHRVLVPGGIAIIIVPDTEGVEPTEDVLYVSPAGPVTGLDIIHGMRSAIEASPAMAHRNGFVEASLIEAMTAAGFARVETRRLGCFNLLGLGVR